MRALYDGSGGVHSGRRSRATRAAATCTASFPHRFGSRLGRPAAPVEVTPRSCQPHPTDSTPAARPSEVTR